MNLAEIHAALTAAENALAPLEALAATFGPFLPAPVQVALAEIKLFQASAPALIAEVEKVVADVEAVYANIKSAVHS
jgi:phage-related minor tail protein